MKKNLYKIAILLLMIVLFIITGCSTEKAGSSESNNNNEQGNQVKDEISFPEKDITFIVPSSPGGGFDTAARILAPYLQKYLPNDVRVVVENRPGSDWQVGINQVINARPDGHTIGIFNVPGNVLGQVTGTARYDLNDISWIGRINEITFMTLTGKDSKYKSLQDLQNGEGIKAAVGGISSTGSLGTMMAGQEVGIDLELVPHDGSTEAILSVVRGDVDWTQQQYEAVASYIESGDLIPLWTYTKERLPELPDTPTIAELGYESLIDMANGHRLIGTTPNTPKEIVAILEDALLKALDDPEFIEDMNKVDIPVNPVGAEEASRIMKNNIEKWMPFKDILLEHR